MTRNVRAITADNASVNTKMLHLLQNDLTGFSVRDGHVRCMAHIINLSAQEMFNHLKAKNNE